MFVCVCGGGGGGGGGGGRTLEKGYIGRKGKGGRERTSNNTIKCTCT